MRPREFSARGLRHTGQRQKRSVRAVLPSPAFATEIRADRPPFYRAKLAPHYLAQKIAGMT